MDDKYNGKGFGQDVKTEYPEGYQPIDYQPGFLAKGVEAVTLGLVNKNSVRPPVTGRHVDAMLGSIKVWSDIQKKMVPAYEYLRETEPVEDNIAKQVAETAAKAEYKVLKNKNPILDPVGTTRNYVISSTIGRIPVAGKVLGRAASKVAGLDVTMMGDATIDGARQRANAAARAEYDQLAVHFKRNEVLAAVRGQRYEPNFLMGIENVRKVTDGFQDFTLKGNDNYEGFVDRPSLDQSPAGQAYRESMWMGKDAVKSYKSAKSASLGKAAMNYDRKNAVPVA